MTFLEYLKSLNDYVGIITIAVGLIAVYIYWKQKEDYKRKSAKLILHEIRYAEQKIRKYREVKQYNLYERLLPTNNWDNNVHLFVKELKEAQIDLISDFYARAAYIDTLIGKISQQKNNPPAIPVPGPTLNPKNNGTQPIQQIMVIPPISQILLQDVSMNVEFLYNTPTVEKLRKLADKKWYHLL